MKKALSRIAGVICALISSIILMLSVSSEFFPEQVFLTQVKANLSSQGVLLMVVAAFLFSVSRNFDLEEKIKELKGDQK